MASYIWRMSGSCEDEYYRKRFSLMTSFQPKGEYEIMKKKVHLMLQNPDEHGAIVFDGVSRKKLTDNILTCLPHYFSTDGYHLFGRKIRKLVIRNIPLRDLRTGLCERMSYGVRCVADLIRKNPNIEIIDLTNTGLNNFDVQGLLDALGSNTKLRSLVLNDNDGITDETLLEKMIIHFDIKNGIKAPLRPLTR